MGHHVMSIKFNLVIYLEYHSFGNITDMRGISQGFLENFTVGSDTGSVI